MLTLEVLDDSDWVFWDGVLARSLAAYGAPYLRADISEGEDDLESNSSSDQSDYDASSFNGPYWSES